MKTNIKLRISIAAHLAVFLLATVPLLAGEPMTRFDARPGSKMRVEGTSIIHDWAMQSTLISGFIEVGPNFPDEPGKEVKPAKVEARGEVWVSVFSLGSVKKDGTHYEDKMDDKAHGMLKMETNPKIVYRLKELVLKEAPKDKTAPYVFDSKGDLAVAGVTNELAMVVNVLPLGDKKLKITGTAPLKMTDFHIEPAKLIIAAFKTSEDVTVKFEWMLAQSKKPAADASK